MRIALYEPDIPQNTGTILRLAACLGVEAHIIEPAGFPTSDRAFRRAGMDYLDQVSIVRHASWTVFDTWRRSEGLRLLLFTTAAAVSYLDHRFRPSDVLMFGRESQNRPGVLRDVGLVEGDPHGGRFGPQWACVNARIGR
jgi:tRNA (cytidine/uridine-2'-O-)-methyltransferase